jgi:hypothetical protein
MVAFNQNPWPQSPESAVEAVARKRRVPIGEDAHQPPVGDQRLDLVLQQERRAGPRRGGGDHHARFVENQLSFDADVQFAVVLFEFPGMEAAAGGQALVDASRSPI